MNKKYELTDETKEIGGITLHRIRALRNIPRYGVKSGDLGGWIEAESNLSQYGEAWVSGEAWVRENALVCNNALVCDNASVSGDASVCNNAIVSGDASVCGNARVSGDASVCGNASVSGNARVSRNAWVRGDAMVCDNARVGNNASVSGHASVCGNAIVYKDADYITFKNTWSSGRYFTYTCSNKMWKVGCFYGNGEELIKKAYADSELSGKCYEAIVRAVETIEAAKAEAKGEAK